MVNYNRYLQDAKATGKRVAWKKAVGNSVLFLVIFCFYAYCFFWGGWLRSEDIKNGDKPYTSGSIIGIMFCVVFGGFGLGAAGPHFTAVQEARTGGKLAFDVINHKPAIPVCDSTKRIFDKKSDNVSIEFKNVTFRYPTKPEVPQID